MHQWLHPGIVLISGNGCSWEPENLKNFHSCFEWDCLTKFILISGKMQLYCLQRSILWYILIAIVRLSWWNLIFFPFSKIWFCRRLKHMHRPWPIGYSNAVLVRQAFHRTGSRIRWMQPMESDGKWRTHPIMAWHKIDAPPVQLLWNPSRENLNWAAVENFLFFKPSSAMLLFVLV